MNRWIPLFLALFLIMTAGCSASKELERDEPIRIGIMLSDVGLGDQSFSDAGFTGLMRARDELGIMFDYRELEDGDDYEEQLRDLVAQGNDLVIGLGFMVQEAIEKVAEDNPEQQFLLIDAVSDSSNVRSLTFKEDEGSYLIGVLAGLKTTTNTVGFIGGVDVPLIRKFENGFRQGVKHVNPEAEVLVSYAGSFGDDKLGAQEANTLIDNGADFIYPAAGFTGVGALQMAQEKGIYGFGVDTDQYFLAEEAVVSSMVKKVDVAVYEVIDTLVKSKELTSEHFQFGLKEKGVGLAPIRIIDLSNEEQKILDKVQTDLMNGTITIQ
ncbi:BMP family lipoprotein [Bacillus solimangrovi]|uniref:BMP family ABC transporter substrate-binding protein n=1 Tax=Bacillus solimangrovi TaxID=1305675 RepID=A0A1E5LBK6_9BACI|nr:BMP family ABC transporter substrate-binding protein [Bacillus solimangrovi]OEH91369.1 BMP family ABC transporter substrate-binding protein [Bacillus solimangrovi]